MSPSIIQIVVALLIVGIILTFGSAFIPAAIGQLIIAVCAVWCLIVVLRMVGFVGGGPPVA